MFAQTPYYSRMPLAYQRSSTRLRIFLRVAPLSWPKLLCECVWKICLCWRAQNQNRRTWSLGPRRQAPPFGRTSDRRCQIKAEKEHIIYTEYRSPLRYVRCALVGLGKVGCGDSGSSEHLLRIGLVGRWSARTEGGFVWTSTANTDGFSGFDSAMSSTDFSGICVDYFNVIWHLILDLFVLVKIGFR